jgi:phosphatidylcholine synthase
VAVAGTNKVPTRPKGFAYAVHVLTASGALCGLLALHYAAMRDWPLTFLWLGIALVIDGADGPLARWAAVEEAWPRFSGVWLDLIVDYLNYCVVPAFIVAESDLVPPSLRFIGAGLILLTSLFHFADRESKTADGYFVGFPAIWNIVCFYMFAFDASPATAFIVIVTLAALTFVPVTWVHPVRAAKARPVTLSVGCAWSLAAIAVIAQGFPAGIVERAVLAAGGFYMIALGLSRTFRARAGHEPGE